MAGACVRPEFISFRSGMRPAIHALTSPEPAESSLEKVGAAVVPASRVPFRRYADHSLYRRAPRAARQSSQTSGPASP